MYALNIEKEKRILSACFVLPNGDYTDMPIVDSLPEGNIADYLYVDGEYIYDPIPIEPVIEQPTQLDRIEAQITYTALMTDTLIAE